MYCKHNKEPIPELIPESTPETTSESTAEPTPENTASEPQDDPVSDTHEENDLNVKEAGSTNEGDSTTIEISDSTPEEDPTTKLGDIEAEGEGELEAEANIQADETGPGDEPNKEDTEEGPGSDADTPTNEGAVEEVETAGAIPTDGTEEAPAESIGQSISSFRLLCFSFLYFFITKIPASSSVQDFMRTRHRWHKLLYDGHGVVLHGPYDPLGTILSFAIGLARWHTPIRSPTCK